MLTKHLYNRKNSSRLAAFGLDVMDVVFSLSGVSVNADSYGVVIASRKHKIRVGKSTGRHLVAIVRNGKVVTILLSHNLDRERMRVDALINA